jgi:hypothetical protein
MADKHRGVTTTVTLRERRSLLPVVEDDQIFDLDPLSDADEFSDGEISSDEDIEISIPRKRRKLSPKIQTKASKPSADEFWNDNEYGYTPPPPFIGNRGGKDGPRQLLNFSLRFTDNNYKANIARIWGLFFGDDVLNRIVTHTNRYSDLY